MKTGRNILLAISCLSFCGLGACGGNVAHYYKDFESLCEDSGGEYKGNGICKCDVDCSEGVICVKGVCANKGECKGNTSKCTNGEYFICENGLFVKNKDCECKKDGKECADCINNSNKCEVSNKKNVYSKCVYGEWIMIDECSSDVSCNNKTGKCGVCKTGEKICRDGEEKKCENGEWVLVKKCDSEECLPDGKCAVCTTGETICQKGEDGIKNAIVRICNQGTYSEDTMECESSECNGNECEKNRICEEDYKKCGKKLLRKCTKGEIEEVSKCKDDIVCRADHFDCGECVVGDNNCTGTKGKKQVCSDDGMWSVVDDESCCEAGDNQCLGNASRHCNSMGVWEEPVMCADNQICEDGTCRECNGDECHPECKDGKCEEPPAEECTSGEVSCEGNFVINCDENGKWVKDECPLGQHCRVDELKCVDNCTDGGCPEGERCDAETNECVKNSGDECDKDKIVKRCENDGDNKVGTIFTSCNGTQETREECVDGNSCNAGLTDCGVCQNGDKKCEEQAVKECTDGNWITKECGEGKKCEDGICKKSNESACQQGKSRCDNNNLQQCLNGNWITKDKCIEKICDIYNGCMEDGTACRFDGDIYCGTWYIATCKDGRVKVIESKPGGDSGAQKSINCKFDTERYVKISFVCNPSSIGSLSMVCEKMDNISDADNMMNCSEYFSVKDKNNEIVLTFKKQELKCTY